MTVTLTLDTRSKTVEEAAVQASDHSARVRLRWQEEGWAAPDCEPRCGVPRDDNADPVS